MSTKLNPIGNALAAVLMSSWLVACAAVWDSSTASGGDRSAAAAEVAAETAAAFHLKPSCASLAAGLAEASMKARTAAFRPTARILRGREALALSAWNAGRCPDAALVGIAFGVSKAVAAGEASRLRGSRLRP